jgi:hypothetical protein
VPSSSYQPTPSAPKQPLPHKEYLSIVFGKPSAAMEQITKRNAGYAGSEMALDASELETLTKIAQALQQHNFSSSYSLSAPADLDAAIASLTRIATNWEPASNRLAPLDLLRFLAAALKTFPAAEIDIVSAVLGSDIFDPASITQNSKLIMLALRLFSNLLYGGGKGMVADHSESIVESLKPVVDLAKSDNNVAIAYTTLCLNLAVSLTTSNGDPFIGLTLIEELVKFIKALPTVNHAAGANAAGQSTEPGYRAVMALGTLIIGLKNEDINNAAKTVYEVPNVLKGLQGRKYLDESRFRDAISQIQGYLA